MLECTRCCSVIPFGLGAGLLMKVGVDLIVGTAVTFGVGSEGLD